MKRAEILHWLKEHRQQVHGDPEDILSRCESEVRKHASDDAWGDARDYVEGRRHQWQEQWGFHASEDHVAREICRRLAAEMRRRESHPRRGDEPHLAGEELLSTLEPEARQQLGEWILELATREKHKTWLEIVKLTRKYGRTLVREGRVSTDHSWEGTENYSAKAVHVAELLAKKLEDHFEPAPSARM